MSRVSLVIVDMCGPEEKWEIAQEILPWNIKAPDPNQQLDQQVEAMCRGEKSAAKPLPDDPIKASIKCGWIAVTSNGLKFNDYRQTVLTQSQKNTLFDLGKGHLAEEF